MLLSDSNINVISSGGMLSSRNRNCLIGGDACTVFENIFADLLFFSVKAISNDGIVTDCSREEVLVRNAMLKSARSSVLLCDSSKFGQSATFRQCHLKEIDFLISEGDNSSRFAEFENRIRLL